MFIIALLLRMICYLTFRDEGLFAFRHLAVWPDVGIKTCPFFKNLGTSTEPLHATMIQGSKKDFPANQMNEELNRGRTFTRESNWKDENLNQMVF